MSESFINAKNDCQLFYILQNLKGITSKSMLSICIPCYGDVKFIIDELHKILSLTKTKYENAFTFSDELDCKDTDHLRKYKYQCLAIKEAIGFLNGIKWQDEDIDGSDPIGLILYFGYTEDVENDKKVAKKLFHTFPCPKGFMDTFKIYQGRRFDITLLNKNPWCVEVFGKF